MENIYLKEEQVVINAEELLKLNKIETENDRLNYMVLLDEYKTLLKHLMMLIRISDLNQSELNSISKKFVIASNVDVLTGLYNRRYFNEIYQKEWSSAVRSKSSLSAIMIDIDFFKKYNDMYGHLNGDTCLKLVAETIRKSVLRPRDIVARYGGEEFIVILPETTIKGAQHVANRIITNIRKLNIIHFDSSAAGNVTVSAGIAAIIPANNDSMTSLIDMSDKALYCSKHEGRNCYREYMHHETVL